MSDLHTKTVTPFSCYTRIWYPSPERNLWKRRYLDAGFIFIQDMIERGAIEVLSGKNITSPGVYVQELPYPCYNRDK